MRRKETQLLRRPLFSQKLAKVLWLAGSLGGSKNWWDLQSGVPQEFVDLVAGLK